MLGLRLGPSGLPLRRLGGGAPTPTPPPPPPPPPPPSISTIVIEGDSETASGTGAIDLSYYSYRYASNRPGKTFHVTAQPSRTVGGPAYAGPPPEGADPGTPTGNTLLDHRTSDLALGPQLLTAMIGANDFGAFSPANTIARLIAWAAPIRAAGVKIAFSPPAPYRDAAPRHGNYAGYTARRAAFLATCRDPSVWGQWADAYIPMGEHPDFADPALIPSLYSDEVHPTGYDYPSAGAGGHNRFHDVFAAAVDTLVDASRTNATTIYGAAWPGSETNLATGTEIVRRFIVRGIAHAGLTSGIAISGGGAQVRLNGGGWGTSIGAIYNGDVIDLKLTTSASYSTTVAVTLRIGAETRTLSFATGGNVTPVAYVHGDVEYFQPDAASLTISRAFAAAGTAVIALNGNFGASVKVGPTGGLVSAARQITQASNGTLEMWIVPVTAGPRDIEITFPGYTSAVAVSWGTVTGADATPTQVEQSSPGNEGSPHATGPLTVPTAGLALAMFAEYAGGASASPASTVNAGTTLIDEGQGSYQNGVPGLAVAARATSGTVSFAGANYGYGSYSRGALVFKAAGT